MLLIVGIIILGAQHINAKHNCSDFVKELGNMQKDFVNCATHNSVPVTFCIKCSEMYKSMKDGYDTIRNNPYCVAQYIDKDRLNLLPSTQAALSDLWAKAYCDSCNVNNTSEFKNKTITLDDCIAVSKVPCKDCMNDYLSLNEFYASLNEHDNGKVCFDIQDWMNRTRNHWSMDLKCCRREFQMTLFTVAVCIVSCLQILFYGGAYVMTKRREGNHEILNEDDPAFNSSAPSSSYGAINLNIGSGEDPSTSAHQNNEQSTVKPSKAFSKLLEDTDDSDESIAGK